MIAPERIASPRANTKSDILFDLATGLRIGFFMLRKHSPIHCNRTQDPHQ